MKYGIIITTHGNNGIYLEQCIESYLQGVNNSYIVVYVNGSRDPKILNIQKKYKMINYIYINDQIKSGGLTNTWNKGIDLCIINKCDVIVLSNDDILFDTSINYILKEAGKCNKNELKYFGPVTNNPGPAIGNKNQYAMRPYDKDPFICKYRNDLWNLNGFFMVFPKHVLIANKFNSKYYFDPKYPFERNETEWFNRFKNIGGLPVIVPRTFIYHYKLKKWRQNNSLNNICIYTINTGNYEGEQILLNNNKDIDTVYFTDNIKLLYKCVEKGIIPFFVKNINNNPKYTQRLIKTFPSIYLPSNYNKSIYIDANCSLKINSLEVFKKLIDKYDLICFNHPVRNNIISEAAAVIKSKLETIQNVSKIISLHKKDNFKDNVGLTETNFLIRNHIKLYNFHREWTTLIKICIRDQISFDYLLWKYNINYLRLPFKSKPITWHKHVNPKTRRIV